MLEQKAFSLPQQQRAWSHCMNAGRLTLILKTYFLELMKMDKILHASQQVHI
jgi:hypothetical protein